MLGTHYVQIVQNDRVAGCGLLLGDEFVVTLSEVVSDDYFHKPLNEITCQGVIQTTAELVETTPLSIPGESHLGLALYRIKSPFRQCGQNALIAFDFMTHHLIKMPLRFVAGQTTRWCQVACDGSLAMNDGVYQVGWLHEDMTEADIVDGTPLWSQDEQYIVGLFKQLEGPKKHGLLIGNKHIIKAFPQLTRYTTNVVDTEQFVRQSKQSARLSNELCLMSDNGDVKLNLFDGLYIERDIGSEIRKSIERLSASDQRQLIVVTGEAGMGKTSLLTWLYNGLVKQSEESHVWLLRASLFQDDSAQGNAKFKQLLQAVKYSLTKVTVLIDTIDLLMQSEQQSLAMVENLFELMDAGALLVCSSRIKEYESQLQPIYEQLTGDLSGLKRHRLSGYSQSELVLAIQSHVHCFYHALQATADSDEAVAKITASMHQGTPLLALCSNPLTLRMLFSVYAPQRINDREVNTFKLYDDFWQVRVTGDKRLFGEAVTGDTGLDLSPAVEKIALRLLVRGTTEVDQRWLGEIPSEQLKALLNRGILTRPSPNTYSFFHQSFFEHSAARAMLRIDGGIETLTDKVFEQPDNLYLLPVFQQCILLALERPGKAYLVAQRVIERLTKSQHLTLVQAGIYLYAHGFEDEKQLLAQFVQKAVFSNTEAVQVNFLTALPNLPTHRLADAYQLLGLLWQRGTWRVQENMCELLISLSAREPALYAEFFYAQGVAARLSASDKDVSLQGKRLSILTDCYLALLAFDKKASIDGLVFCFNQLTALVTGAGILGKILDIVAEHLEDYGSELVANTFLSAMMAVDYADGFRTKANTYQENGGRLMYVLAQSQGLSIDVFYQKYQSVEGRIQQLIVYHTLDHFVTADPQRGLPQLFELIENEADIRKQYLLFSITFAKVVEKLSEDRHWQAQWQQTLLVFVKRQFAQGDANRQNQLVNFLGYIGSDTQVTFLMAMQPIKPQQWLDRKGLFKLVVQGAANQMDEAQNAMLSVVEDNDYGKMLASQFRALCCRSPKALALLLNHFGVSRKLSQALYDVLLEGQFEYDYKAVLIDHIEQINAGLLLDAGSEIEHHTAQLNVLSQLLLIDGLRLQQPEHEQLVTRYQKARNRHFRLAVVRYWLAYGRRRQPIWTAVQMQQLLKDCSDPQLQILLIELASVCSGDMTAKVKLVEFILDECLAPVKSLTIEVVSAMRYNFEVLIHAMQIQPAADLFIRFLLLYDQKFSMKQKKDATHKLLTISSCICKTLCSQTLAQWLDVVKKVDRFSGRVILDAACKTRLRDCRHMLVELIGDEQIADELKEMVRKYTYHHHRGDWRIDWPEAHELIEKYPD